MYLSRSISYQGARHEMVGIIPADAVMGERPQGRGLVRVEETADAPWPGARVGAAAPAHEFHYARLENAAPDLRYAYRMQRGFGVDGRHDGIVVGNLLASFTHLRDTSRNHWAERFVAFIRARKAQTGAAPQKATADGDYPRLRSAG